METQDPKGVSRVKFKDQILNDVGRRENRNPEQECLVSQTPISESSKAVRKPNKGAGGAEIQDPEKSGCGC